MNDNISKILSEGLLAGFTGKVKISDVDRSSFKGKANDYASANGKYHDEWFVPTQVGGGQELVQVGEEMFTRLYGGGTPSEKKLSELGITSKDVGAYLVKYLTTLGNTTRLFEECKPEPDGDWQYTYEKLLDDENIPVVVFVESIYYKGTRVHLHPFILSKVI